MGGRGMHTARTQRIFKRMASTPNPPIHVLSFIANFLRVRFDRWDPEHVALLLCAQNLLYKACLLILRRHFDGHVDLTFANDEKVARLARLAMVYA